MLSPADITAPQSAPQSVCIFGDSHIASVKNALDLGLMPYVAPHLEFWGAYGPAFRQLNFKANAVHPGADAAEMVERINGQGRMVLEGSAFDAFLFYGARLRMADFMPPLLETLCDGGYLTAAVRQKVARRFLRGTRSYRIAREFARLNPEARVAFAPTSLLTLGVGTPGRTWPGADAATQVERDEIRGWLDEEAAADNIVLIHQPDHTIVEGYWTDPTWAATEETSTLDPVHKSPAFAAMMVQEFINTF